MKENKKYWLAPIFVTLVIVGALLALAQGSVLRLSSTVFSKDRRRRSSIGDSTLNHGSAARLVVDGEIALLARKQQSYASET